MQHGKRKGPEGPFLFRCGLCVFELAHHVLGQFAALCVSVFTRDPFQTFHHAPLSAVSAGSAIISAPALAVIIRHVVPGVTVPRRVQSAGQCPDRAILNTVVHRVCVKMNVTDFTALPVSFFLLYHTQKRYYCKLSDFSDFFSSLFFAWTLMASMCASESMYESPVAIAPARATI